MLVPTEYKEFIGAMTSFLNKCEPIQTAVSVALYSFSAVCITSALVSLKWLVWG